MAGDMGGRAFPTGTATKCYEGMTLLDYYAAHAPFDISDAHNAVRMADPSTEITGDTLLNMLADLRIAYARKMLQARESQLT